MHKKRRWVINPVTTVEELAEMLTQRTWTLCSGFYVVGHEDVLFLNDSTSEDAAAEFGIVKGGIEGPHLQVESVTFSWCSIARAATFIRRAIAGEFDLEDFARPITLSGHLDRPQDHDRCHLCA